MSTDAPSQSLLPLEEAPPDGRVFVNGTVWFVDNDGYRVVFRWHEPLYRIALDDEVHLRLVAVTLRQSKLATSEEICLAFGHIRGNPRSLGTPVPPSRHGWLGIQEAQRPRTRVG